MPNANLSKAKSAKNDEFYTQYADIQREVNAYLEYDAGVFRGKTVLLPCDDPEWSNFTKFFAQNFELFGLKKLISTSYAIDCKRSKYGELFDFAEGDDTASGKIFVLDHDTNKNGRIDIEDLEWRYLEGDGDFRSDEVKKLILESKLTIYICEGEEPEIKEWFKTINTEGVPLNEQELLNAIYSGPFVTAAKEEFSNSGNANLQKWKAYVKGNEKRQEILREAINWASKGHIDGYMARHRRDTEIKELKTYFMSVIDWINGVFAGTKDEMCGLEWGRLYETYHKNAYNPAKVWERVEALYADDCVNNRRGIFEYVLGGETDTKLLDVRVFDKTTIKAVYAKQTAEAQKKGVSNCPLCAVGHAANARRIYAPAEMDADHVTAWSKGGVTSIANCQMLCKTHNRAKGNR